MRRWMVVVLTVVVLGVAAWIGWPRDGGEPVAGTDPAVAGQDADGTAGAGPDDGDAEASGPAAGGDEVDPGDAALDVVDEPEFDADEKPSRQVEATWDDDVRQAARQAATATMRAFAGSGQAADWWDELSPLLTPQARVVYEDVDPRNVPVTEVTGTAEIGDESSTLLTEVTVPTDAGAYTVLLVRADGGSPWLAEQIRPPS